MSKQKKHLLASVSALIPSENGLLLDRSIPSKLPEATISTMLRATLTSTVLSNPLPPQTSIRESSIVESHPQNKKVISKDKPNTFLRNTQITKSSKKPPAVSTSKGKFSIGFWTEHSKEVSKKLWLPIRTGSAGLPGNTSTGSSKSSESLSWSTVKTRRIVLRRSNSLTTSCPLSMSSQADIMEAEQEAELRKHLMCKLKSRQILENKAAKRLNRPAVKIALSKTDKTIPKSRVISLFPTQDQARIMSDWIAATRKTWNMVHHEAESNPEAQISEVGLRNKFVIKKHMTLSPKTEWLFRTHKRIREYAVRDYVSSVKGGITRLKKGQIRSFKMKPKSANADIQTICVSHEASSLTARGLKIHGQDLRTKETLPIEKLENNMRLTRYPGGWRLQVPYFISEADLLSRECEENDDIVSLDPGLKRFMTFYSPRGESGESGSDLWAWIREMTDKEKMAATHKRKKKISRRLINRIEDYHWKLSHWLLRRYRTILVPRLYVSKNTCPLVREGQKHMKHCAFVDRLKCKMLEYKGRRVVECKEYYTSKTCGKCGWINRGLGSSDVFECKECGVRIGRDLNGARNILIRCC